jgi:hypothetical protein
MRTLLAEVQGVVAQPGEEATRVAFPVFQDVGTDRLADMRALGFEQGAFDFIEQQALTQRSGRCGNCDL